MPEAYVNYFKMGMASLESIGIKEKKPSLLLHACCGPCACWPLRLLAPYFDITIYYNNSNIFPESEYRRRLEELRKLLSYLKDDYGFTVSLIIPPYDNKKYNIDLEPYKDQPEGLERCHICYRKRMDEAFSYAESHGYDYFTTVMTISRQKNSQTLNKIGEELQKKYPHTKYFFSDFKKGQGIDKGREMRIHYGLYNQLYCGCVYTFNKGLEKAKEKGLDWKG